MFCNMCLPAFGLKLENRDKVSQGSGVVSRFEISVVSSLFDLELFSKIICWTFSLISLCTTKLLLSLWWQLDASSSV